MALYAFGSNGSGQLGIGHKDDVSIPEQCQYLCDDKGKPTKVVASGNATFLLLSDGRVCRTGAQEASSATDFSTDPSFSAMFREIELTKKHPANLCSASWTVSIVATLENEIYVSGKGGKGELGLGPNWTATADYVKIVQFPPKGTTVVDICSSVSHTVVILSNGEAHGWGNGRKGQLGEPSGIVWAPRKIEGLNFNAVRVVCGREFTLFAGEPLGGKFAIFGSDKWGVKSQAPRTIGCWKDIGASWGSIFVLSKEGSLHSWGRDDHGQLAPTNLPQINSMAIGSEHVVVLLEAGKVMCWGWGEHGNCGESAYTPAWAEGVCNSIQTADSRVPACVYGVGAGCATSFFWRAENDATESTASGRN